MVNFKGLTADRKRGNVVVVMPDYARFNAGLIVPFFGLRIAYNRQFQPLENKGNSQRDDRNKEIKPVFQ